MGDQIRRRNFDQICRLCLEYASDKNTLFPIFINEANIPGFYGRFLKEFKESIPEVISTCIGIEIDPLEKLPLHICSNCEKQLITSNQFREKCLQSNDYLLELLMAGENDNFDSDDDSLQKQPELILVDSIKEEHIEMDSSCDSVWDNVDAGANKFDGKSSRNKKTDSQKVTKKSATKRTKTMPLITPSTPIVPVNCNEAASNLPKRSVKYVYAKKPKMCTVCGVIVDRLRDHMRTHPEGLEYNCTFCSRRYLTKKGLSKHIRNQHTEDSIAQNPTHATIAHKRYLETLKKYRGESYISSNGVVRGAKCIGPACKQCIYKCPINISIEQRNRLFDNFYNLGNIQKQWEYIARCTDRVKPKYRRVVENSKRKRNERNLNVAYYFQVNGDRIRVCKTFLMNTLGISNSVIRTTLVKCNENGELMVGDRRGGKGAKS